MGGPNMSLAMALSMAISCQVTAGLSWTTPASSVALVTFIGLSLGGASDAATITAPAFRNSSADIPNPERGFYRATDTNNLDTLTQDDANDAFTNGYRLLYARINLENYRTTNTIPTSFLTALRRGFGFARSAGVKLIIRAVYNYPESEEDYEDAQDAPLSRIRAHLAQLKPILQNNSDVTAYVQAGFIGAWGEWHTSSNGLAEDPAARAAVRDAVLDAIPSSRFVQFRYPPHLQEWVSTPPSPDEAVANNFRLGFHNDCFLSGIEDVGTYSEDATIRNQERAYTDRLGDAAPVGGETCDSTWDPAAVRRTACSDILGEGERYNFNFLNDEYWRPQFHERWISDGCMPEIRRRMGYRLALTRASHEDTVVRGGTFILSFSVTNQGWARPFNPRLVQVILQDISSNSAQRLTASGADPRRWLPGTRTASVNATVPSGLPAGTYRVLLALADPAQTLTSDPRYAIRFANDDNSSVSQYWDSRLGAFALGTTLRVRQ